MKTSGNIKSGDLVRVKKYGWIMECKGMDGQMLILQNTPKSMNYQRRNGLTQKSGNNGTYLFSDVETINKMAKGGLTEHGLEIGDKITGRNHGDKIEGYNKEMRENFTTDLDSGKRSRSRYAKGGSTRDRGALSKREKDFIKEELKNGKGEGFIYQSKILFGDTVVIRKKNNIPLKKWVFENFTIAKKIADKLNQGNTMAKGGKTKGKKEPMVVRSYFEDEAIDYAKGGGVDYYEQLAVYVQGVGSIYNGTSMRKAIEKARAYEKKKPNAEIVIVDEKYGDEYDTDGNFKNEFAKGGAIYKGDKVKIKDTNKSMVVKNIAKGKKGYVEFTGDKGTYLKGDLEKFAKGGEIKVGDKVKIVKGANKGLKGVVSNSERDFFGDYTIDTNGNKLYGFKKGDLKKYEDGGEVGSDNYKVVKIFRKSGRKEVLRKYLTREEAQRVVNSYPNSNTSMVVFTKMFEEGGMTSGWCYSIGGL